MRPLEGIDTLLCDADGNLFPSEEPAFVASCDVTNELMAALGVDRRFTPEELRLATTGKNFRTTAADIAHDAGVELPAEMLERWVEDERRRVSAYLGTALGPDPEVSEPLERLARSHRLAAVSSSASPRLDACFRATGLAELFPPHLRFSAEDSLPRPTSKPDPAIYKFAMDRLGVTAEQSIAIEDSVPGAQSAVAAGIRTVGNVAFVPPSERVERERSLKIAGVMGIITSWSEFEELLAQPVSAELAGRR
jgi:beta-phosphoglucomutase-like phosphatase (HAD superfamily)